MQEVEEFKHIQTKLTDDAQDRLCDFLVRKMRAILEEVFTLNIYLKIETFCEIYKINLNVYAI